MPLSLQLEALTVPEGSQFPGTVQGLLDLIAEYEAIIGGENFSGINYGPTEPAAEDRDKPWFKTDESDNPIGWFAWDGSSWTAVPIILPSGTTAQRPENADVGQLYLDTDIDVMLRWNGSTWITADGSPGDVKMVKAPTLSEALTRNPGWSHDTDSAGKFVIGATDGTGAGEFEYGEEYGENEHTLALDELPNDAIDLQSGWGIFPGQFQNGSQGAGIFPITTGLGAGATEATGPLNPDTQVPISLIPASIAYWRLVKDE